MKTVNIREGTLGSGVRLTYGVLLSAGHDTFFVLTSHVLVQMLAAD